MLAVGMCYFILIKAFVHFTSSLDLFSGIMR